MLRIVLLLILRMPTIFIRPIAGGVVHIIIIVTIFLDNINIVFSIAIIIGVYNTPCSKHSIRSNDLITFINIFSRQYAYLKFLIRIA